MVEYWLNQPLDVSVAAVNFEPICKIKIKKNINDN